VAGLIWKFDRVACVLYETATIIRQRQILLAFAVGDIKCIGGKCNGNDENLDNAICIMLNCLPREKLQRGRGISAADGNISMHCGRLCVNRLEIETCNQKKYQTQLEPLSSHFVLLNLVDPVEISYPTGWVVSKFGFANDSLLLVCNLQINPIAVKFPAVYPF
jgi:hypothetical protein